MNPKKIPAEVPACDGDEDTNRVKTTTSISVIKLQSHEPQVRAPAFQFYPADYLADMKIRMLSWASRGLYIDLLCYCWREGWIPSDSSAIAQLCHCQDTAIIEPCLALFSPHPDDPQKLVHPILDAERQKQKAFREERKASGIKGAAKRWGGDSSAINQPMAKNSSSVFSLLSSDIPPTPQRGKGESPKKSAKTPSSPQAIRIAELFHRRLTTPWSAKEVKAYKALGTIDSEDLELVCQYTETERSKGDDVGRHRRDLLTFLNNYHGELDRARAKTPTNLPGIVMVAGRAMKS